MAKKRKRGLASKAIRIYYRIKGDKTTHVKVIQLPKNKFVKLNSTITYMLYSCIHVSFKQVKGKRYKPIK